MATKNCWASGEAGESQRAVTPSPLESRFESFLAHQHEAPFVYRLGHRPFTAGRGVRFPYGVPKQSCSVDALHVIPKSRILRSVGQP